MALYPLVPRPRWTVSVFSFILECLLYSRDIESSILRLRRIKSFGTQCSSILNSCLVLAMTFSTVKP